MSADPAKDYLDHVESLLAQAVAQRDEFDKRQAHWFNEHFKARNRIRELEEHGLYLVARAVNLEMENESMREELARLRALPGVPT